MPPSWVSGFHAENAGAAPFERAVINKTVLPKDGTIPAFVEAGFLSPFESRETRRFAFSPNLPRRFSKEECWSGWGSTVAKEPENASLLNVNL